VAKMKMTKENLVDVLNDFFGLNEQDGTYFYELTRVKSAFDVGTMTMHDFEEINETQIEDLANVIWDKFSKR
jgi:hypothetical protein